MGRHRKALLWILLALGPLLAGGVALLSLTTPPEPEIADGIGGQSEDRDATKNTEPAMETVDATILEATTDIEAGTIIQQRHTRERETKRESEEGAGAPLTNEELIGSVARATIKAGEEIRDSQIVRAGRAGYLTAAIRPGNRAIAVRVGEATARAGLVNTGDHVDVILSAEVRTLLGERERYAQTIVHNARVIGIDHNPGRRAGPSEAEEEAPGPLTTVTLEASKEDVQRLAAAEHEGALEIALRSERETSQANEHRSTATRLRAVIVPSELVRLDDARIEMSRHVAQSEARAAIARNERESGSGGVGGRVVRIARGAEPVVERVFGETTQ